MRDRAKNDIVLESMIFQKVIGPDIFHWIRHYVAEICALLGALVVTTVAETLDGKLKSIFVITFL